MLPERPATLGACQRPASLPDRPLTQGEVEALWTADRANLVKCGLTLDGLIAFYDGLAESLRAAERRPK